MDDAFAAEDDEWERQYRWGVYRRRISVRRMAAWAWFWAVLATATLQLGPLAFGSVLVFGFGLILAPVVVSMALVPPFVAIVASIETVARDRARSWATVSALVSAGLVVAAAVVAARGS